MDFSGLSEDYVFPVIAHFKSNSFAEDSQLKTKLEEAVKPFNFTSLSFLDKLNLLIVCFQEEINAVRALNALSEFEQIASLQKLDRQRTTQDTLELPEVRANFLISPPASPPEGWESIPEKAPCTQSLKDYKSEDEFAYDLINKLGKIKEKILVPPSEIAPSVILHLASDEETDPKRQRVPLSSVPKEAYTISRPQN